MKFSLRWLSRYIDLTVPLPRMLEKLTLAGTEVEGVATAGVDSPHVVVGQIVSFKQHPNADRLSVCQVNDGTGLRQIVCGAKNFKEGDKAPLALPGAKLPGDFTIKESKLRGELSQGMLCSAKELAIAEDAEGLLILPPDAPVGKVFNDYWPSDTIFEVEVTSNRPDLLSYRGIARGDRRHRRGHDQGPARAGHRLSLRSAGLDRDALRARPWPLLFRHASHRREGRAEPGVAGGGDRVDRPPADQQRGRHHQTTCSSRPASRCTPSTRASSPAASSTCAAPARARRSRRSTTRPTRCSLPTLSSPTAPAPWPSPA
ncbi:MAG: hypothetical protein WDO13_06650 [Verrucomicrobiota bacterium]